MQYVIKNKFVVLLCLVLNFMVISLITAGQTKVAAEAKISVEKQLKSISRSSWTVEEIGALLVRIGYTPYTDAALARGAGYSEGDSHRKLRVKHVIFLQSSDRLKVDEIVLADTLLGGLNTNWSRRVTKQKLFNFLSFFVFAGGKSGVPGADMRALQLMKQAVPTGKLEVKIQNIRGDKYYRDGERLFEASMQDLGRKLTEVERVIQRSSVGAARVEDITSLSGDGKKELKALKVLNNGLSRRIRKIQSKRLRRQLLILLKSYYRVYIRLDDQVRGEIGYVVDRLTDRGGSRPVVVRDENDDGDGDNVIQFKLRSEVNSDDEVLASGERLDSSDLTELAESVDLNPSLLSRSLTLLRTSKLLGSTVKRLEKALDALRRSK